jgi:hypothetical protein
VRVQGVQRGARGGQWGRVLPLGWAAEVGGGSHPVARRRAGCAIPVVWIKGDRVQAARHGLGGMFGSLRPCEAGALKTRETIGWGLGWSSSPTRPGLSRAIPSSVIWG